MINLDDLADQDPDNYIRIRNTIIRSAEAWAKDYFNQSWARVCEVADVPKRYPNEVSGYSVVVEMPEYPQRERLEVLIGPDESLSIRLPASDSLDE